MDVILLIALIVFVSVLVLIVWLRRRALRDGLVIRDGVLYIFGWDSRVECLTHNPVSDGDSGECIPWSKELLLEHLRQMQEMIDERYPMAMIEALVIEPMVAIGLWQHGDLTAEHIASVKALVFSGYRPEQFTIIGWLDGIDLVVKRRCDYYCFWEFSVKNHPEGIVRVRPDSDLQWIENVEEFFPAQI